ncbi:MAG: type II secretion system protein GspN [Bdellovibrionales bacterium]
MKGLIQSLIHTFRFHKFKVIFFVASLVFSLVILFPFQDVGDFVSSQVSKMTNNQIFVQFREPSLSLFPGFGIKLNEVHVETPLFPPLQARSLSVYPSIASLLAFKPGMNIHAVGLMGGDIDMGLKQAKLNNKTTSQNISIDGNNLDLNQLIKLSPIPLGLQGKVKISGYTDIDPQMVEQPSGRIELQVNQFVLPTEVVPTPLGPLALPSITLKNVTFEGVLKDGRLQIERFTAGQGNDELVAQVKGRVDVRVATLAGRTQLIPGSYDIEVRLTTVTSFEQKASLFLSFLSDYKKSSNAANTQYALRLTGSNFNVPPRITIL